MPRRVQVRTDGSSVGDRGQTIRIDRTDPVDRMRWRCPNNHTSWEPTNSHAYCSCCSQQIDRDPEHWELLDAKTGELVPWSAIVLE